MCDSTAQLLQADGRTVKELWFTPHRVSASRDHDCAHHQHDCIKYRHTDVHTFLIWRLLFDALDDDTCGMRLRPVVLIADDTPDQAQYPNALSDHYTIQRATSGRSALSQALTERPDAIVLDLLEPRDDGFATCARLKDHPVTAAIPVLLLTASNAPDVEARAVQAGAITVLRKPCSAERLSLTLNAAIAVHSEARNRRTRSAR